MALSLREAAEHTGTKPSTILRAILSGRLPFDRDDEGSYAFDRDALDKVFSAERRVDASRIPLAQLRVVATDEEAAPA